MSATIATPAIATPSDVILSDVTPASADSARADPATIDLQAAREVPYAYARDHGVLVARRLEGERGGLRDVWISDSTHPLALAELQRMLGPIRPLHVVPEVLQRAIDSAYANADPQSDAAARVVDEVQGSIELTRLMQELPEVEDLLEASDDAPVIRLINALLTQAARDGASDIHLEPFESHSVVRFRIDGTLRDVVRPKRQLHAALVSRIKIMANLDIAEKRLPQDGRISLRVAGRAVDVRVSTLPVGNSAMQSERAVLRLLDKAAGRLDLTGLGMADSTLATFDSLIRQPHGIVLVTGPTGSGKTTTLYAALGRLDAATTNILTVEDPIEYELPGIGQTQVQSRIDMSFAKALRAILRQDPDVIMIGEIRDLETAQIAVQASLTGHLVLATLHTNDAVSAITRLADMGIEPFLLSSSLLGVVAQRLVRRLCPLCKQKLGSEYNFPELALPLNKLYSDPNYSDLTPHEKQLGSEYNSFSDVSLGGSSGDTASARAHAEYHPVGCGHCGHTGYQGRTGIYELLVIDERQRGLIHDRAAEPVLRAAAQAAGMSGLREDGERWIRAGVTAREEVVRVTRD